MTHGFTRLSENEKIFLICVIYPPFWPFLFTYLIGRVLYSIYACARDAWRWLRS